MKRGLVFLSLTVFCFLFTVEAVFAQRGGSRSEVIDVRLASPLPRNSDWGRGLDRLAADWARVTNNEVRLRIIHDGVEGGESKMLSSLRADNIQAALFASSGLSEICPPVMTLSIPFYIKNDAELDLVLKSVLPVLGTRVDNNFTVVAWAKGGWVSVFSKEPVFTPDDLRRQKMATNPELRDMNLAFRTMGFNVVETDMIDIGPKLANNVINAIYFAPPMVAPMGLHRYLKHMMNTPIAPAMGAIVMNRVTWNKIGPERQQEIVRATQRIAAEFDAQVPRTTESAVASMNRDGLIVNRLSRAQEELWHTELNKALPSLIGTPAFDRTLYQQINGILERARNGQ